MYILFTDGDIIFSEAVPGVRIWSAELGLFRQHHGNQQLHQVSLLLQI
jgi:hypothetical protein